MRRLIGDSSHRHNRNDSEREGNWQSSDDIGDKSSGQSGLVGKKSVRSNVDVQLVASLSITQVKSKLRSLGQPIALFGENEEEKRERLLEALHEKENASADDQLQLGREGFDTRKRGEKDDSDDSDDDDGGGGEDNDGNPSKKRKYDPSVMYHKMEGITEQKVIRKYFKMLVKVWENDLEERDEHEKRSAKGREQTKLFKQCKDHIRPLFKLCKQKKIPLDIQEKLIKMVTFCEEGNFRAANDQYILTAIGKAAWPMGITMVSLKFSPLYSNYVNDPFNNISHIRWVYMNAQAEKEFRNLPSRRLLM